MPTIEEIVRRKDEWIRMARKIGADEHLANDLVSEMFIKTLDIDRSPEGLARIEYKGDINTMFIFVTLRNLFIDHCRKEQKRVELNPHFVVSGEEYIQQNEFLELLLEKRKAAEYDNADREFERLCDCIDRELKNEHWYNQKIFEVFHEREDLSLRKMEDETGIPYYSIFETIKNVKTTIKEKCSKQWQAYKKAREKA